MSYFGVSSRNGVSFGIQSVAAFNRSTLVAGPSLAIGFLNTTLDPKITFTRASTATYINSAGAITNAAINEARFDYDPVSLAPKGLLIEEQRTNALLNSASLGTQSVVFGATPCTLSFYGSGTVVISGTHSATVVGLGAYPARKIYTFTPTAGILVLTVTGTVQNAQLEAGSFATSWIPTTGAIATRNADSALITGANFSSWFNPSQGTLFAQADLFATNPGPKMAVASLDDGSSDGYILYKNGSSAKFLAGLGADAAILGTTVVNTVFKTAVAYDGLNNAGIFNTEGLINIPSGGGEVTEPLQLCIGRSLTTQNIMSGHVSKIVYYPRRLSDIELQLITA